MVLGIINNCFACFDSKTLPLLYKSLVRLKLPSLAHRRRRGDMIYTYKIITGKFDINKKAFFERSHLRTRGHKYKIYKEHATKLPQINTSNRIVNDWNELPAEIVEAASINSFKNKLVNTRLKKYTKHHFIKH